MKEREVQEVSREKEDLWGPQGPLDYEVLMEVLALTDLREVLDPREHQVTKVLQALLVSLVNGECQGQQALKEEEETLDYLDKKARLARWEKEDPRVSPVPLDPPARLEVLETLVSQDLLEKPELQVQWATGVRLDPREYKDSPDPQASPACLA